VFAPILSLKLPIAPAQVPLAEQLPVGRLIEIASGALSAQMTTAVACLRQAQAEGETTAWVQRAGGSLYPPDLADSGIDLDALLVVNVPASAGAYGSQKASELLLRSGGFGMVVLDLLGIPLQSDSAWQGRLLGLAREHQSFLLLLSDGALGVSGSLNDSAPRSGSLNDSAPRSGSLGPLVSLCLAPQRKRIERGVFAIEQHVRKDKSGHLGALAAEHRRGPWGLL
jgi:recombination protein RecA